MERGLFAEVQGADEGILGHNFLAISEAHGLHNSRGQQSKVGNIKGFKDDVFSREMHSLKAHKTIYPLACLPRDS